MKYRLWINGIKGKWQNTESDIDGLIERLWGAIDDGDSYLLEVDEHNFYIFPSQQIQYLRIETFE